jgi:protein-S-isoprenylcysteine O-methyltransferase Ste14
MPDFFEQGLRLSWLAIFGYWIWSARRLKRTARFENPLKQLLLYWLPMIGAFYLLGPGERFGHGWLREQFVPHSTLVYSLGLALCVAGAALAIWARHLLGANWSGNVQVKEDHELITAGPYSRVRHPIYTGLLAMFAGSALMVGDIRGLVALAVMSVSFWLKLRAEEKWMLEQFGDRYRRYMQGTRALVPGLV